MLIWMSGNAENTLKPALYCRTPYLAIQDDRE